MRIIEQSHEILHITPGVLEKIEQAARTCYKSEDRIEPGSAKELIKRLINNGHHAMLEFGDIAVKFVTNRSVTHELVRHRLCSFAQESTRYVKYDKEMTFIKPVWCDDMVLGTWYSPPNYINNQYAAECLFLDSLHLAKTYYNRLLAQGRRAQQAREVLPNALKTEIVVKANIREWRHIFKLRCSSGAHPQIHDLMYDLLLILQGRIPIVFDDIMKG